MEEMPPRLRRLLSGHPVFTQNAGAVESTKGKYAGCGLASTIFTNGYLSFGARSSNMHTDYKNPLATHLTTRLFGTWDEETLTGQTVLCDRFVTRALVVADDSNGRQLIGGLNAFRHANCLPEARVDD